MRVDFLLLYAGQVRGDCVFLVQPEMFGVGANESFVEDAAGEPVEVLLFDGLEHARADLGDLGSVIERDALLLARFAEFVAELAHAGLPVIREHHRISSAGLPLPRGLVIGNRAEMRKSEHWG